MQEIWWGAQAAFCAANIHDISRTVLCIFPFNCSALLLSVHSVCHSILPVWGCAYKHNGCAYKHFGFTSLPCSIKRWIKDVGQGFIFDCMFSIKIFSFSFPPPPPFLISLPSTEPTLRPLCSPSSSSACTNTCWTWWNNCITAVYGSDYHQQLGMLAQGWKVTWIPIPITLWQLLLKESQLLTIMRSQNTQAFFDCDSQPNQQGKENCCPWVVWNLCLSLLSWSNGLTQDPLT